jgi:hypothetical protein
MLAMWVQIEGDCKTGVVDVLELVNVAERWRACPR